MTDQTEEFEFQQPLKMPKKLPDGTVIPPWCPWDEGKFQLNTRVTYEGGPLLSCDKEILVGHIHPARRWAVEPDGEIMELELFKRQYVQLLSYYNLAETADLTKEAVPEPQKWVDYRSGGAPIHFNPLSLGEQKIEAKYTQDGDISKHYKAAQDLSNLNLLNELRAKGLIDAEQFAEEVEDILTGNEDKIIGSAEDVGMADVPTEPSMAMAACGKEVKAIGRGAHELRCKACQELKADEPDST